MLLAHGAGSRADVVRRLLGPCVPEGIPVVAPELRGGLDEMVRSLADAVDDCEVVLAGGISMGAHALVVLAATTGAPWPMALVMPAWTGSPDHVAAATAAAADDLASRGRGSVLMALAEDPATRDDWVREELADGWAAYDDDSLVATLRAASTSRGPTPAELRSVAGPVAVVALDDDPLHPAVVARRWADEIPRAALTTVPRHAPAADRGVLGRAAREALDGLSGSR